MAGTLDRSLAQSVARLNAGGQWLWEGIALKYELDEAQKAQLLEACRAKDRCDQLDETLRGHITTWATIEANNEQFELVVDKAMDKAMASANIMKQLLAAMRLPDDVSGKRPTYRGSRGSVAPKVPGGAAKPMSALEKARQARSA
jgi:hypothetical protein